ncbi:epimerase [Bifidobacterium sp. DSM 109958]|uniref:Epimerase n=1 Tax=Bifidobacterium moraviense TaxID=2675323 RepID=A0A7Y0F046_9BIFI|nr:DUF1304 domain-containing protein [Bifidobacterium sp. DSM 109958]NMM99578.1 epimerase [Bifidobacterium sp. DSM 109958]
MLIAACTFAILAGLLHVLIFVLESFRWTDPKTMHIFSIPSAQEAEATKEMAYNQGFYNLFLGLMALTGAVLAPLGHTVVGVTLMTAGTGSMTAAALVLFAGSPDKRTAAAKQFVFPALTLLALFASALI